jgi:hypothetical protein
MLVPEAAMHKNRKFISGQDKIRTPREILTVEAKTISGAMQG